MSANALGKLYPTCLGIMVSEHKRTLPQGIKLDTSQRKASGEAIGDQALCGVEKDCPMSVP